MIVLYYFDLATRGVKLSPLNPPQGGLLGAVDFTPPRLQRGVSGFTF